MGTWLTDIAVWEELIPRVNILACEQVAQNLTINWILKKWILFFPYKNAATYSLFLRKRCSAAFTSQLLKVLRSPVMLSCSVLLHKDLQNRSRRTDLQKLLSNIIFNIIIFNCKCKTVKLLLMFWLQLGCCHNIWKSESGKGQRH